MSSKQILIDLDRHLEDKIHSFHLRIDDRIIDPRARDMLLACLQELEEIQTWLKERGLFEEVTRIESLEEDF